MMRSLVLLLLCRLTCWSEDPATEKELAYYLGVEPSQIPRGGMEFDQKRLRYEFCVRRINEYRGPVGSDVISFTDGQWLCLFRDWQSRPDTSAVVVRDIIRDMSVFYYEDAERKLSWARSGRNSVPALSVMVRVYMEYLAARSVMTLPKEVFEADTMSENLLSALKFVWPRLGAPYLEVRDWYEASDEWSQKRIESIVPMLLFYNEPSRVVRVRDTASAVFDDKNVRWLLVMAKRELEARPASRAAFERFVGLMRTQGDPRSIQHLLGILYSGRCFETYVLLKALTRPGETTKEIEQLCGHLEHLAARSVAEFLQRRGDSQRRTANLPPAEVAIANEYWATVPVQFDEKDPQSCMRMLDALSAKWSLIAHLVPELAPNDLIRFRKPPEEDDGP